MIFTMMKLDHKVRTQPQGWVYELCELLFTGRMSAVISYNDDGTRELHWWATGALDHETRAPFTLSLLRPRLSKDHEVYLVPDPRTWEMLTSDLIENFKFWHSVYYGGCAVVYRMPLSQC